MKKIILTLLAAMLLLTACGADNTTGISEKDTVSEKGNGGGATQEAELNSNLPKDPRLLLISAAEKTASEEKVSLTSVIFTYDLAQESGGDNGVILCNRVEQWDSVMQPHEPGQPTSGTFYGQNDWWTIKTSNEFYMDSTGDGVGVSYAQKALAHYRAPLYMASEEFLSYHLPDNAEIRQEGDLVCVKYVIEYQFLNEVISGDMVTQDAGRLAQLRFYVDAQGYLKKLEMDYSPIPSGEGKIYTSSITYEAFGDAAGEVRLDADKGTERLSSVFPEESEGSIDMSLIKPYGYTVTTDEAMKYLNRLSVGSTATIALKDDGTVYCNGDEESFGDVASWSDIKAVYGGHGVVFGIKNDGSLVYSGGELTVDISEFKDLVSITDTHDTLFGLKSDGTVIAVGADAHLVEGWTDVVQFSANGDVSIAIGLRADGTVLVAGPENCLDANQWTDIVQVYAGRYHVLGLKADGTVVMTGNLHTNAEEVSRWTDIVLVTAGNQTTVGIKSDGTMVSAGFNASEYHEDWRYLLCSTVASQGVLALRSDGKIYRTGHSNYHDMDVTGWDILQ